MYTVSIPPTFPFERVVRVFGRRDARRVLDVHEFEVDSPVLTATREATPLVRRLRLFDERMFLKSFNDTRVREKKGELLRVTDCQTTKDLYSVAINHEGPGGPSVRESTRDTAKTLLGEGARSKTNYRAS